MKYTRYDYKKKNNSLSLVIILVSVLIVSFLLGTGIMTIITKQSKSDNHTPGTSSVDSPAPNKEQTQVAENTSIKLVVIQSGVFKNKDYAEASKNKLREHVIPFTIVEGESIRILAGIFNEEESGKVIQLLNEKQITNTKTVFEISKSDLCDAEIAEIIQGYIKILSRLREANVAAVQTDDFKNWINTSLQPVDAKSKNFATLEELKKYMAGLPQDIGKDKVEEGYVFLYNMLKKVTAK